MPYQVRVTARAEWDADEIMDYLGRRSRQGVARWLGWLVKAVQSHAEHPERCGLAPEAEEMGIELRQLLFGRRRHAYRLLFTISGDTVNILHVRRGSRGSLSFDEL
jgi:plasmid stabilization system protein ParE